MCEREINKASTRERERAIEELRVYARARERMREGWQREIHDLIIFAEYCLFYRSLLQKRPIKETIFCNRLAQLLCSARAHKQGRERERTSEGERELTYRRLRFRKTAILFFGRASRRGVTYRVNEMLCI